jgi:hypothetical protein
MLVLSDDFRNRVELLGGLRNMDPEILSPTLEVKFRDETLLIVGRDPPTDWKRSSRVDSRRISAKRLNAWSQCVSRNSKLRAHSPRSEPA